MKKLLIAIFIVSLSVIGCDLPYTGPILTVDDVDRYLHSVGEDTSCLEVGFDGICVKIIPGDRGPQGPPGPPGPPGPKDHWDHRATLVQTPPLSIFTNRALFTISIMKANSFYGQKRQTDTSELLELLAVQQGNQGSGNQGGITPRNNGGNKAINGNQW